MGTMRFNVTGSFVSLTTGRTCNAVQEWLVWDSETQRNVHQFRTRRAAQLMADRLNINPETRLRDVNFHAYVAA